MTPFSGTVIRLGTTDDRVAMIRQRLVELGIEPGLAPGKAFDEKAAAAVMEFQARYTDLRGVPLTVDGVVGPMTWAALFTDRTAPVTTPRSAFAGKVLDVADSQVGTMESPLGSNCGPKVDLFLRSCELDPTADSYPWCMAFVYWCVREVAGSGGTNPLKPTAGVLSQWNHVAPVNRLDANDVAQRPDLVKPGDIFIMDYGGGKGHTGFVEAISDGWMTTIEGNTNQGGSREGIGVFRRNGRKISHANRGFIMLP